MTVPELRSDFNASQAATSVISRILYNQLVDKRVAYKDLKVKASLRAGPKVQNKQVIIFDLVDVVALLHERLTYQKTTVDVRSQKSVHHTTRVLTELEAILEECEALGLPTDD